MAGIVIELSVDDKGTVKVKQFTDETKKAFEQMKKGPEEAKGPMNALHDTWVAVTAKVALATGALYAAKSMFFDTAKEIASATMEIEKQSKLVGMSTDEFQRWTFAAKMSDVQQEEFTFGLRLLSKNMEDAAQGTGDASKYFKAMGISVADAEGHLRPLNDVMGDIATKFASWEEGPRKIAVALALFGRGGEAIIPMLNRGKTGIEGYWKEAEKLGIILSPDLIRKGAEAEDIFKRIETRWKVGKLELSGYVLEFGKFLEKIDDLRRKNIGFFKSEDLKPEDLGRRLGIAGTPEQVRDLARQYGVEYQDFVKKQEEWWMRLDVYERRPGEFKTPAPFVPAKEIDWVKEVQTALDSMNQLAEEAGQVAMARQELEEKGYVKQIFWVEQVREELARFETETNEWGEITVAKQDLVESGWKNVKDAESETRRILTEYAKTFGDTVLEQKIRLEELAVETQKLTTLGVPQEAIEKYTQAVKSNMSEMKATWQELGNNINQVWSQNVTGILKGTTTIKDAFKNMATGMADAFISAVTKMIANWILFQNVQGTYKEGQGWSAESAVY
jgi:hypothetical protein